MSFNSLPFLFIFLPLALAGYFLIPQKFRNLALLFFSLFLCAWIDKIFVLVLIYSTVANYLCGLLIEDGKRRTGFILALFVNLLLLGFFKYYNFTISSVIDLLKVFNIHINHLDVYTSLAIPIGISFYTFKNLSYIFDVYHSKVKASRNFVEFATYVTMFPPLIAGPIVRYVEIQNQLHERKIGIVRFSDGIERFIIGLSKKMLIANTFASVSDQVFATPVSDLSTPMAWVGIIAYTFQIYFDFSGYSDMAIGLGKMFGFDLPENFNYPYIARNIKDFWRRWHITLSNWLRDYLFLPMAYSLSRKLKGEIYLTIKTEHILYVFSIVITFIICGFWHGAALNFIVWGLWYGVFLGIEHAGLGRILKRSWKPLQHVYTLLVVILGWVIFRTENLTHAGQYFIKLFSFSNGDEALNSYLYFFNVTREFSFFTLVAVLFSTPVYQYCKEKARAFMKKNAFFEISLTYAGVIILVVLFFVSVTYIASGTYNAFIYAQF